MYKQFCDRCGRVTKNNCTFLLPVDAKEGTYNYAGAWFGSKGVVLCNICLEEFDNFRTTHERFNKDLIGE